MSKNDRLSFIKQRHAALFGVALSMGFLPITRREIQDEIRGTITQNQTDNEIMDEEIQGIAPSIIFNPAEMERDNAGLLTAKEKRQLANELAPLRAFKSIIASQPLRLMA